MSTCHNFSIPIANGNGSNETIMPTFSPFYPNVPSNVTFSLTMFYLVIYCVVFLSVYTQLWLILYYNYKRFSFQTVFLYLCLLWSGLRATLFSFYIKNTMTANELPMFVYWLIYCFPVCLQFCTLCLLNLYFAQVMFKAKSKYAANPSRYIIPLRMSCFLAVTIFFVMNITCAAIVHNEVLAADPAQNLNLVRGIVIARVLVNDILFVVCAVSLAYCFLKISKTTSANILLEAKGTTVCQALSVGIVIVLLYASRAIYNLIAISPLRCAKLSSFNFDWYNVSDQADLVNLKESMSYVVFGVVLFVWELLPTSLTVFFFKVRKPDSTIQTAIGALTGNGYNSRVYFFDNPQRYDSEEDLTSSQAGAERSYFSSSTPISNSAHLSVSNTNLLVSKRSPRNSPNHRLANSTPVRFH